MKKKINKLKIENKRLEDFKKLILDQNEKEIAFLKAENQRLKEDIEISNEQYKAEIENIKSTFLSHIFSPFIE